MNTIELVNTLPRVFAGQPGIQSEVWLKTLRFERGKKISDFGGKRLRKVVAVRISLRLPQGL